MTTINEETPIIHVKGDEIEGESIRGMINDLDRVQLPLELKKQIETELEQIEDIPKTGGGPGTSAFAYGAVYITCATLMYLAFSKLENAVGGTTFQDFQSAFFDKDCSRPRPSTWDRAWKTYTYDELRENPFCTKLTTTYFDAITRVLSTLASAGISPVEFYSNVKQGKTFLYYTKIIFGTCTAGAFAVGAYAMAAGPAGGKSRTKKSKKTKKTKKSRKQRQKK